MEYNIEQIEKRNEKNKRRRQIIKKCIICYYSNTFI